jgi:hypothetical protein
VITVEQYLMGRTQGMTETLWSNARNTVLRTNWLRGHYLLDHPDAPAWVVRSGRRTPEGNAKIAGAAPQSNHLQCNALDIGDTSRRLARWAFANLHILADLDLYMEDPRCTPTWLHIQTVPPLSRNRVFIPSADWARRLSGQALTLGSIR